MSSVPSLSEVREVFETLWPSGTPFTTTEVATTFDCSDRTVYNRLETFVEDGVLETKKVGARGRVWWRPVGGDSKNEQSIEETYQKLFESINKGLCIIEVLFDADEQPVDYRFLETNSAFDELTGALDVAGKRIRELDVNHNDNRIEKYGVAAQTGEPIQFTEYSEFLGEQLCEVNAFRIGDPTEHTVAVLFDNVTEREHPENRLGEGKERVEALLEATTEGVYRISPDWSEIYQLAGENFITDDPPNTWQEYIPEDDRERVGEAINEAIKTQSPFELQHRITRADGTIGWVDTRVVPILEDGEIVEWLGTATDITARKEQERKRQEVVNRVTDGIIETDADWRCTFINGQGGELTNTSEVELLGQTFWEVFEDARETTFEKKYREVMDTREPVSFVEYYPKLDGWFDVQAYPNDDGGVAIYFRDVTERKEREKVRNRAEKRYQKLLELAPLPIIAVDPTTEEILEANEAAGELIGCQPDELIGRMRASVHPTENSDRYDTIFEKATERGGTWRHLPDGSPPYVVTEHGEEIPVKIIGKKVELEGNDVVYGILQDISDQLKYQHRLQKLNEVTHKLFNAKTEQEVTQTAVEALADILERSTVGFYSFNEDEWKLEPVVHTTSSEEAEEIDQLPVFEPGVGVEWHTFVDGQTTIVNDFQSRETEYGFDRTVRSELAVPIADWGVLVAGDTRPDIFDDWTANLMETLVITLKSALEHTEWERELREQRRELREIESLNQQIRDITHTIVQAESRVELEQSVCEQLVESDTIEFAWIGNVDLESKAVAPRAQAGTGDIYLDNVSLTLDRNTDSEPSVQALQSRDVCGCSNVTTNIQHSDWRSMAVEQGFRSVLSVPLVYREALYGTLTVYSQKTSGFPDALESVLKELCNLIAHSTAAIEQKEALQTTQTAELEFEIRDEETLFCRFATVLNCEIELERTVPQKGESTLAFFSVADGTLEKLPEEANRLDGIEGGHLLKRANDTLIQLRLTKPCIASVLADRGLLLRRLFADSTHCRLTVEVPKSFDPRQAVNIMMLQYEDVQLLAKRESDTSFDTSPDAMLDVLTPRQREVVETAYRVGYFDSPRRVSGKDVAEMFGFSNSTFHEHVRKAERTLFENLIEDASSSLAK